MPKRIYQGLHPSEAIAERRSTPRLARAAAASPPPPVECPVSDGLPMADSDAQARTMHYADYALQEHFRARGVESYVATDTFVFYRNGDPDMRVAPDVFVVMGVPGRERVSYKVWEEGGKAPARVDRRELATIDPNLHLQSTS